MIAPLGLAIALLAQQGQAASAAEIFSKPNLDKPRVVSSSAIFSFMKPGQSPASFYPQAPDFTGVSIPALKPGALTVRVFALILERDFSNPTRNVTLSTLDKSRLLSALQRVQLLGAAFSEGAIKLEIVPQIIDEPIFDRDFVAEYLAGENNRAKFEADDSIDRGPFAATIVISGGPSDSKFMVDGEPVPFESFSGLRGSSGQMFMEAGLWHAIQHSALTRVAQLIPGAAAELKPADGQVLKSSLFSEKFAPLLLGTARNNGPLWTEFLAAPKHAEVIPANKFTDGVTGPITVTEANGVLEITEASILRAGQVALPTIEDAGKSKSLEFEVSTDSGEPMSVYLYRTKKGSPRLEYAFGNYAPIKILKDKSWNKLTVALPPGDGPIQVEIAPSLAVLGSNRWESRVTPWSFRSFKLSDAEGTQPSPFRWNDEKAQSKPEEILADKSAPNEDVRLALNFLVSQPTVDPGLRAILFKKALDIDAYTCFFASRALGKTLTELDPTKPESGQFLQALMASTTESGRQGALAAVAANPKIGTFDSVIANTVRKQLLTRIFAADAIAAFDATTIPQRPACRQILLSLTSQESATVRFHAVKALNAKVEAEQQRIRYLLLNDPSERIRLQCVRMLAAIPDFKEDELLSLLSDESPHVRMTLPELLDSRPATLRKALQRLVVDRDPFVRARALRGFLILPDTKMEEIQNVFGDTHPAVAEVVQEGIQSGKWKKPGA